MCGICALFCKYQSLNDKRYNIPELLLRRGPNGIGEASFSSSKCDVKGEIIASVLCCRAEHCVQPISDEESGNILAWNGEVFGGINVETENDALVLSKQLSVCSSEDDVVRVILKIEGPYSFVLWHRSLNMIFFGRDVLGRRSLTISVDSDAETVIVSSVLPQCGRPSAGEELLPTGIFSSRLDGVTGMFSSQLTVRYYQWPQLEQKLDSLGHLQHFFGDIVFKPINNPLVSPSPGQLDDWELPDEESNEKLKTIAAAFSSQSENFDTRSFKQIYDQYIVNFPQLDCLLNEFALVFRESCQRRCNVVPFSCLNCTVSSMPCCHCRFGVLFSGGLDSTILAAIVDEYLPENEQVDLLNVAFFAQTSRKSNNAASLPPDRQTGLDVFTSLEQLPSRRKFNLVCVDVSQEELHAIRRTRIRELILPCETILDDSLGCALWFATSWERSSEFFKGEMPYQSPAKVLFHGLGADELFAGYSRHRASFQNGGWSAVRACLLSDVSQLPHRNLGRDDRVASDNSRELRHPFLDENVIRFVLSNVPIYLRFNPYMSRSVGDKIFLRFFALKLAESIGGISRWRESLLKAAIFPKRAIQFGSRIANIEKESVRAASTATGRRINASDVSKKLLDEQ